MLILAKVLLSAGTFGGVDLAPICLAAPMMPAPVTQARPPKPPKPPRISPPARNPLQQARDRLAGRTIGGGRAVDRMRDRRFWENTAKDKERDADKDKAEPDGMSDAEVKAQADAMAKTRKRLLDKTRRAKGALNKAKDPQSPKALLAKFELEYYGQIGKIVADTEIALLKGGAPPALLAKLVALPKRPKDLPKPEKGSFEDLREKFLLKESKAFSISARSSKDRGVKELYLRFQRYAAQRAYAKV